MTEDNDKLNEEQVRLLKLLKQIGFKQFGLNDFIVYKKLLRCTRNLVFGVSYHHV